MRNFEHTSLRQPKFQKSGNSRGQIKSNEASRHKHKNRGHKSTGIHMAITARATTPDLLCYEDMPTPAELAELASSRTSTPAPNMPILAQLAEDCWCLENCPGPRCRRNRQLSRTPPTKVSNKRAYEAFEPRGYTSADDPWPQRVVIWHPGDFVSSPLTLCAGVTFRATFHAFCVAQKLERKHVRFIWERPRKGGCVEIVELKDSDAPWDLGFREGRTEHVECEYV